MPGGMSENKSADASATEIKNEKEPKETQATELLKVVEKFDIKFFKGPDQERYATFHVETHRETHAINSSAFREWLISRFYYAKGKPPHDQSVKSALGCFHSKARFEGPEREVYIRLAQTSDAIYIDLGSSDWDAIEITADGWSKVSAPPVYFRRAAGMTAMPEPSRREPLELLRPFLNIAPGNDRDWYLLIGFLLGPCAEKDHSRSSN
jgi:putative DNA primase/helicase